MAGFTEDPNGIQTSDFEILLCLLFAELYRGLQAFLKSDEMWQS